MIHDYPDQLRAYAYDDELAVVEPVGRSNVKWIVATVVGIALLFAAVIPQIDFDYLGQEFDRLIGRSSAPAVIKPTKEQAELIRETLADQTKVAAEGEAAEEINAALPFGTGPVESALPFFLTDNSMTNGDKALRCMTQAVYYEAGFENVAGRYAVAQVILNRMRHPAFPKSVCGVIYQGAKRPGCQFSFACDGSLYRAPNPRAWAEAQKVAQDVLNGVVASSVGMATHYHANYVSPYWAPKLHKITQIGAHIFYRWPGNWGRRVAFNGVYRGGEFIPSVSTLANMNAGTMTETVEGETPLLTDIPATVRDVTDRRADNDLGGRIDTSKPWRLTMPMGSEIKKDVPATEPVAVPPLEAAQ